MSEIKRMPTPWSYSQAVEAGEFVFLGIHRGSGDTFEEQFHGTFAFLKDTMAKLDLSLENIVKVNVWLKDIHDLPKMEKLFYEVFDEGKFPARMTSTTEFIDADCLMMIDGIAYRGVGV
jgi:2-iminobutanoate/2-iminopropanoate deaminase